jgi:hypothetical protein
VKRYPHKPREKELSIFQEEDLSDYQSNLSYISRAEAEHNPMFFEGLCQDAIDLAALEYAFDAPLSEVCNLLATACDYAEKAVLFDLVLDTVTYMTYLALANLRQQGEFRKMLESFQRSKFTNEEIEEDEIFYLGAEAMGHISAGRFDLAEKSISAALARANSRSVDRDAKEVMVPIVLLEQAIVEKDQSKLAEAIKARHEEYRRNYSHVEVRNYPEGLLDVLGLGLLKLARRNGLDVATESVYLPTELLEE